MPVIRSLRPGEPVPDGVPRRYTSGQGYVRLRWRVGPGEYVECYEHRLVAGLPRGRQVHHVDRDRANNDPANLQVLSDPEHGHEHRRLDHARILALLREGLSQNEVARLVGCDGSTVNRLAQREGVPKGRQWNAVHVDPSEVVRRHRSGMRVPAIARALGVPEPTVRRVLREAGEKPHPPGRPRSAE